MDKIDVIIIGAGVVGAALACALGQAQVNVVLIDSHSAPDPERLTQDIRVSAITYGCQQWLAQLQAWQALSAAHLGVLRTMRVWDAQVELLLDSADLGIPALGYIAPNLLLNQALLQQLAGLPSVQVLRPVTPVALHFSEQQVLLNLDTEQLAAKLIVGADGAQSWVREQCRFELKTQSYQHSAIVAELTIEKNHQQCAYQRFKQHDILAFLPLADPHHCSLVWSTIPERAQDLMSLSDTEFALALQKMWGDDLGKITLSSTRKSFPLFMQHADNYVQERIALIGDAAHTIHPLAGQGLNLGLQDAHCLAQVIIDRLHRNRDIGRYSNLRSFERLRRWHNGLMLKIVAGNKWIFAQTDPKLVDLRHTGLHLLNHLPVIKRNIIQLATFGEVPEIC